MEQHVFGVAEVNQLVKQLLDGEPMLQNIYVRGELSNYKMYPSGHHYFTLKDADGALRCVMFRGQASRLRFRPENGMQVIARGRITVFPRDGAYQLYCDPRRGRETWQLPSSSSRPSSTPKGFLTPPIKSRCPGIPSASLW